MDFFSGRSLKKEAKFYVLFRSMLCLTSTISTLHVGHRFTGSFSRMTRDVAQHHTHLEACTQLAFFSSKDPPLKWWIFQRLLLSSAGDQQKLGGGFKYFVFSPPPGEMIQFDEHFFKWVDTTN